MNHCWGALAAAVASLFLCAPAGAETIEAQVLSQINYARMHPQDYARDLRRYRKQLRSSPAASSEAGRMIPREGTPALDEAIRFLDNQRPMAPLQSAGILSNAALDLTLDQGPRGIVGHVSRTGLTAGGRVQRDGGGSYVAETISYGMATAADVVRQLIIDDGVKGRGHRTILFMSDLRYAGVGCGTHSYYGSMCVIDYSVTSDGRLAMQPSKRGSRWL